MTVKELLIEKLETLLPEEQQKVIKFIDFLEYSRQAKVQQLLPKDKTISPLGNRLRATRAKIITSGKPLLTPEEADSEKAERRGGYQGDYFY